MIGMLLCSTGRATPGGVVWWASAYGSPIFIIQIIGKALRANLKVSDNLLTVMKFSELSHDRSRAEIKQNAALAEPVYGGVAKCCSFESGKTVTLCETECHGCWVTCPKDEGSPVES